MNAIAPSVAVAPFSHPLSSWWAMLGSDVLQSWNGGEWSDNFVVRSDEDATRAERMAHKTTLYRISRPASQGHPQMIFGGPSVASWRVKVAVGDVSPSFSLTFDNQEEAELFAWSAHQANEAVSCLLFGPDGAEIK